MYSKYANYYLIIFIDTHYEHIGVLLNIYSSFCMCMYTYMLNNYHYNPDHKKGVHSI